jgi:uncharacterized protein (TIGR03437 family)
MSCQSPLRLRVGLLGLLLIFSSVLCGQSDSGYLIVTVAGNGRQGFSGDGGLATAASIEFSAHLCVGASGNLFIADAGNHRIRKVTPTGMISTVAGSGTRGFGGDGGPATSAQLNSPWGIAVDASGSLYIADSQNNRIRKVTPTGMISTVAGSGAEGFAGDGGPATAAQLRNPWDLAVDSVGSIYVADTDNHRIRKITAGGVITTLAGNGSRSFSGDGGPATTASLNAPFGVALDGFGNVYIADGLNNRIRKVSPGGTISTVLQVTAAVGVAADSTGTLYVTEPRSHRVRGLTTQGAGVIVAGNGTRGFGGDGGPAITASLNNPLGLAVDPLGNLFLMDDANLRVRKLLRGQSTQGCMYSIDQAARSFTTEGGESSVAVLTNEIRCPWLAGSYVDWIAVTSGTSGSGNGLVTYAVAPNPTSTARTGTLWVAGKTLLITQPGLACSISINPRTIAVSSTGAIGNSLTVTANAPDCRWTASTSAAWILLSGGTSGTANGTVGYTVGINTGGFRTGTIAIAGHSVYVNQAGAGESVLSIASFETSRVVNAASYRPPIAPGSFVTIYGQNLADTSASWDSAIKDGRTLPQELSGVRVRINGRNCFIYYVQPTQINVLTPPDNASGPVDVEVITSRGAVAATVTMASVSPAWFTYNLDGTPHLAALFANENVFVAAEGAVPGGLSRPAKPGDFIQLYANGLGPTSPAHPVGQVLTGAYPISDLSRIRVHVGGVPAPVQFVGMTFAGVFQVYIQVPEGIRDGALPVVLQIDGLSTQENAVLTFDR